LKINAIHNHMGVVGEMDKQMDSFSDFFHATSNFVATQRLLH